MLELFVEIFRNEEKFMIYEEGMFCKHFKGKTLLEKNIYEVLKIGVKWADLEKFSGEVKYSGDGDFMTATNLVLYRNIFQNGKMFAREYEDISSELSPEKQKEFNQTLKVQPLSQEELEIVFSEKFKKDKQEFEEAKQKI